MTYLAVSQVTHNPLIGFFFFHGRDERIGFVYTWTEAERLNDLGEELLRVAPDLHGSLGADVLCTNGDEKRG